MNYFGFGSFKIFAVKYSRLPNISKKFLNESENADWSIHAKILTKPNFCTKSNPFSAWKSIDMPPHIYIYIYIERERERLRRRDRHILTDDNHLYRQNYNTNIYY